MRGAFAAGMWSSPLCIVWAYLKKKGVRVDVDELLDFILNEVPQDKKFLYEDKDDVIRDLRMLEKLDVLKLEGNVAVLTDKQVEWMEEMMKTLKHGSSRELFPEVDEFFRTVASVIQ